MQTGVNSIIASRILIIGKFACNFVFFLSDKQQVLSDKRQDLLFDIAVQYFFYVTSLVATILK